jgi:predicted secreted protein
MGFLTALWTEAPIFVFAFFIMLLAMIPLLVMAQKKAVREMEARGEDPRTTAGAPPLETDKQVRFAIYTTIRTAVVFMALLLIVSYFADNR